MKALGMPAHKHETGEHLNFTAALQFLQQFGSMVDSFGSPKNAFGSTCQRTVSSWSHQLVVKVRVRDRTLLKGAPDWSHNVINFSLHIACKTFSTLRTLGKHSTLFLETWWVQQLDGAPNERVETSKIWAIFLSVIWNLLKALGVICTQGSLAQVVDAEGHIICN